MTIEEKLRNTPRLPGVYLLKDKQGSMLYVGKAKQLRNRLRSHFKPGRNEDLRHRRLMAKVTDFETIVTDSEVEALIMEANFVKNHKPRYNVNLKDDKSFPYIRITHELYPRIFITRKMVRDGSHYFGPYTDVGSMRQLMHAIRRIFPVRNCGLQISEDTLLEKKHKVCLMAHIGRCYGPCEGRISPKDYAWYVGQVEAFIEGKNDQLIQDLESRMKELAVAQKYEEAAELRDQIHSVGTFYSRQKVVDQIRVERDLLAVAAEGKLACGLVFQVREGKIINRLQFRLGGSEHSSLQDIMASFVEQYYVRAEFIPSEVMLSEKIEDVEHVAAWLSGRKKKRVAVVIPQRGRKASLMAMCEENANLILKEWMLQKEASGEYVASSVSALQKDLAMEHPPMRIEAFDNSNIQGSDPVASLVVFENGRPKKSEYRKFKIRTVKGIDDFASMAEVLERRIVRLLKEKKELPDLILVDGGKGQLSAAVSVLEKYELREQPIIGLAKRLEEVFRPGLSDPQTLPKTSPSLRLLQNIRDEAHRFAITFHRSLRKKRMVQSELDTIPGVGEKRRKALIRAFGSVAGIREAGMDEIARVKGMNKKVAEEILAALKMNSES